ncbi:hypothetical protein F0562_007164 [Nyssa sinensis]|uniref:DUF4283 domain-containing protein n=1 Tax=Nyssa sinensis TaxID=561372 RepID=A0A5J5A4L2_9ASTE|nr:hypothetical protein F0562_007164 [Nyssa sinensis]
MNSPDCNNPTTLTNDSTTGVQAKSSEEVDHLEQSTKKIKNSDTSMGEMDVDHETVQHQSNTNHNSNKGYTTVKPKSFKEAPIEKNKEWGFYNPNLDEELFEDDGEDIEDLEEGDFEVIDLRSVYFLFKFDMFKDCVHVFSGGSWIILDHYLTVQRWKPDFRPLSGTVSKTTVWVRLLELPIE